MHRRIAATALFAAAISVAGPAFAAEPTPQELMDQIKQLQAKVQQLEAKQNKTDADVAATVDQIVKDAEKRSQLMGDMGGISGNWKEGSFILSSDDGRYVMKPGAFFQFRNVTNYNTEDDSVENGFEIRRAKFFVAGNLFNPELTYRIQYATSSSSGAIKLEDAWAQYQYAKNWSVRGGQFINPVVHEQLVLAPRQLAADRSLMNLLLTGEQENYVQGVALVYDDRERWHIEAAFTDGVGSENTTWQDYPTNSTNFGAAGRVEYYAKGKDRKQYYDLSSLGDKEDLVVLGMGGTTTQAGSTTTYLGTVDANWQSPKGFNLYGAYLAQLINDSGDDTYNWGFLVQGGYFFNPQWEAFVRYDVTIFADEVAFPGGGTEDVFPEATIGVNYFVVKHAAQFTIDLSYLPNGCPNNQTGLGYVAGDEAQFALRAQFQLML